MSSSYQLKNYQQLAAWGRRSQFSLGGGPGRMTRIDWMALRQGIYSHQKLDSMDY